MVCSAWIMSGICRGNQLLDGTIGFSSLHLVQTIGIHVSEAFQSFLALHTDWVWIAISRVPGCSPHYSLPSCNQKRNWPAKEWLIDFFFLSRNLHSTERWQKSYPMNNWLVAAERLYRRLLFWFSDVGSPEHCIADFVKRCSVLRW